MKRASSLLGAVVMLATLFCISKSHAQTEGPDGHYYKVVVEPNLSWEEARLAAAASSHNGVHGYLATIKSLEEDRFVNLLRQQSTSNSLVWLGGSQHPDVTSAPDGWFWVNGEGAIPGENGGRTYANWDWQTGEPDGSGHFLALGGTNISGWSSEAENAAVAGYVVEYSGAGTENTVSVATIDPIATETGEPGDIATFEFQREGNLALDLPVFYSIHGTAGNGMDYDEIAKSVIIPAGESSVRLNIVPRADASTEPMDTIGIRVEPSLILTPEAAYRIDAEAREATAVIYDMGPPARGSLQTVMTGGWNIEFEKGEPVGIIAALSFSNQVSTVDFWRTDFQTGESNKLATVEAFSRTNQLAFYRYIWTNPPVGTHMVTAIAHTPSPGSIRLASFGMRVHVVGTEQPVVSIRAVPPADPLAMPNADYAYGFFEVRREGSTEGDLQVHYTVNSSATAGSDYEQIADYVVIGAGRRSAKVAINAVDDARTEPKEFVELTLLPATNNTSSYVVDEENDVAVVWIFDNETFPPPIHSVVSVEATKPDSWEGQAGTNEITGEFTVRRSLTDLRPMKVYLAIGGTATRQDYIGLPNIVSFEGGRSEVKLPFHPSADNRVEGDETIIAELIAPPMSIAPDISIGYQIDPNRNKAVAMIHDGTAPDLPLVSIEARDPNASEPNPNGDNGEFVVRRSGPTNTALRVQWVWGGSARLREDYTADTNSVSFAPGQTQVTRPIIPLADRAVEGDETVIAELIGGVSSYNINPEKRSARVTIHDAPAQPEPPVVSIRAKVPEIEEPDFDHTIYVYELSRTGPTNTTLAVQLQYRGSATFGQDFIGTNRIIFPPGAVAFPFEIQFLTDDLVEGDETIIAGIVPAPMDPPLYRIDPEMAEATVIIDDRGGSSNTNVVVSIEATRADIVEPVSGSSIEYVFALRRTGPTNTALPVLVDYRGTATFGRDYIGTNRVVIPAGAAEYPWFSVRTFADNEVESPETIVAQVLGNSATNTLPYLADPQKHVAWVTLHDSAGTNTTRRVIIVEPADGATFLQDEMVPVVVHAFSPGALITKLELLFSPTGITSTTGPLLEARLGGFELGEHTFQARATDSLGNVFRSEPVRILVRHRDAVSFVRRDLPPTYAPGVALTVELRAVPPEGTHAYSVEDQPPTGWQVSQISHEGSFDAANGKVKFGPFTDSTNRALTYTITPPANASGSQSVEGNGSVNGAIYPISGDDSMELIQQVHPADQNGDFAIVLGEVTAYTAAWSSGESWPTRPSPIPMSYATSAASIWKRGESYRFDPTRGSAPNCWVPINSTNGIFVAQVAGSVERVVPVSFQAGTSAQIQITATPSLSAASYALEEKPPRGWAVSNISHDGTFDPEAGAIRWGVFFDGTPRTLSYTLTPPAGVASLGCINGEFSFDGQIIDVSSASVIAASGASMEISEFTSGTDGLTLGITGPAGQTAVIESTSDFVRWDEVQSIFIPGGEMQFKTVEPPTGPMFYRLRVE